MVMTKVLDDFEKEYYKAYTYGISLNPILNSFQQTVQYQDDMIQSFLKSRLDLVKSDYNSQEEYGSIFMVLLM
jgi:hypothetical protein